MDTERKRKFVINTFYYSILALVAYLLIKYGLSMLAPFVAAFLIAWVLQGPTRFLTRKLNLPKKPVALAVVLVFYSTVGLLIGLAGIRIFTGIRDLVLLLPQLYTNLLEPALTDVFLRVESWVYQLDINLFTMIQGYDDTIMSWIATFVSGLSGKAVSAASSLATAIPGLFLSLVLMIISTFFLAGDFDVLMGFCARQMGEQATALFLQIKRYVVGTLFVCIGSYAIIASLTFVELSIGLSIIRVRYAVLIAFCIAIFDILPVLGTGGIMVPWVVLSLLRGQFSRALGLLVVYVAITVIRNIVEPKIVGGQLGLHPVVTLASMFAGVQLFGVVGLFGFPIGLSLLRYLNDNGSIRIFKGPVTIPDPPQEESP